MNKKEIQATTEKKGNKLVAIASTEDQDRAGDVLSVKKWNFSNFLKNPVLQAGHDYRPQFTIGVAKNLRVEGTQVLFEPIFHSITPLAKQIAQMYEDGFLKAWSVGFIPAMDANGMNELLEVSAVAVPANANALMKSMDSMDTGSANQVSLEIKSWMADNIENGLGETEEKTTEKTAEETVVESVVEAKEEKAKDVPTKKKEEEYQTTIVENHSHSVMVDEETGNGETTMVLAEDGAEVSEHKHTITDWKLDEVNGHTHVIERTSEDKPEETPTEDTPMPILNGVSPDREWHNVILKDMTHCVHLMCNNDNGENDQMIDELHKKICDNKKPQKGTEAKSVEVEQKIGRVISKSNETLIRTAHESLGSVLASLDAQPEKTVDDSSNQTRDIPRKPKNVKKVSSEDLMLKTLQGIVKVTNQAIHTHKNSK